jgi:hypothetical protein
LQEDRQKKQKVSLPTILEGGRQLNTTEEVSGNSREHQQQPAHTNRLHYCAPRPYWCVRWFGDDLYS